MNFNFQGKSDPSKAQPGTIRGDFGVQVKRNVVHASESVEEAQREIDLWFKVRWSSSFTISCET
jgi:nucleoside-diphosphate kinase